MTEKLAESDPSADGEAMVAVPAVFTIVISKTLAFSPIGRVVVVVAVQLLKDVGENCASDASDDVLPLETVGVSTIHSAEDRLAPATLACVV